MRRTGAKKRARPSRWDVRVRAPKRRVLYRGRKGGNGELKFHDVPMDDAVIAANGSILKDSVVLIAQGVTESERIGRKCVVESINWRYAVGLVSEVGAGAQDADTVRVILYWDKQTNGAVATVTGILETDDYQSFRNLANGGRFTILMDKTLSFNPRAGAGDGAANDWPATIMNYTFYKKCNIPIEYDSVNGVLTELRSNNLGVLLLSKKGLCSFESNLRIRFSDG